MTDLIERFNWNHSPETGLLADDVYLSERIEEHATPTQARSPGVYVLELAIPESTSVELYNRLWLQEHDTVPNYLESIATSRRLLYVGKSESDVYDRLRTHIDHPNRSTTLAATFPIHHIVDLNLTDTGEKAKDEEHATRIKLSNNLSNVHVHSR